MSSTWIAGWLMSAAVLLAPPALAADLAPASDAAAAAPPSDAAAAQPAGASTGQAGQPSAAPATAVLAPAPGPMVAYVKHTKPPLLIDQTPAAAAFGLVGTAAAMSSGNSIVLNNQIEDPSGEIAHQVALAYAAAHGAHVADAPLSDDHKWTRAKGATLAGEANGASYVIDVDPPGMNLIYFPLDWTHFDLMFMSFVRVIDTSNGEVVAKARCYLKPVKTADTKTHGELLADKAANLKQLIALKSQRCVDELKTALRL